MRKKYVGKLMNTFVKKQLLLLALLSVHSGLGVGSSNHVLCL